MDKTDLFIEYCKSLGGIPDRPHSTGYIRKKQINTTATFLYHVIAGCKGRKKSGSFGTLAIKMKRFSPENVICMRQLGPLARLLANASRPHGWKKTLARKRKDLPDQWGCRAMPAYTRKNVVSSEARTAETAAEAATTALTLLHGRAALVVGNLVREGQHEVAWHVVVVAVGDAVAADATRIAST